MFIIPHNKYLLESIDMDREQIIEELSLLFKVMKISPNEYGVHSVQRQEGTSHLYSILYENILICEEIQLDSVEDIRESLKEVLVANNNSESYLISNKSSKIKTLYIGEFEMEYLRNGLRYLIQTFS